MRLSSPERLVVLGTAGALLFSGCSSPSSEQTSAEPRVTVTEYALPSEASSPIETATPQAPDTELSTPTPSPTEKPKTNKNKAKSMGFVVLDNCAGLDVPYDIESFENQPGWHAVTNIGELAYGKKYDPKAPQHSICKTTPVSVSKILDKLVVRIEKKGPQITFQSYSTSPGKTQKPIKFEAITLADALLVQKGNASKVINCKTQYEQLAKDAICEDKKLSSQEIAKAMIAPSPLRAEVTMLVLKMTAKQRSLKSAEPGDPVAIINFKLPVGSN